MKIKNNILLASVMTVTLSATALAQDKKPENKQLHSAIMSAIDHNPEVQESWHRFLASGYGYEEAKHGYRPKIDGVAGYDFFTQNYGQHRDYDGYRTEITLEQMLYDGFYTRSAVSHFKNLQLVSYFDLLTAAEKVAFDAYAAYMDVQRQRGLVDLARKNLEKHHEVYTQVEKSSEAGIARSSDLEQIKGRLSLAQSNLVTEMSNLHDVSARYLRIVGELPPKNLEDYELDAGKLPSGIQEALELAYQGSPLYHSALRNIKAAEDGKKVAQADLHPKINFNASYGTKSYDSLGFSETQTGARAGVELRYNFYSGHQHSNNIKKNNEYINEAKEQRMRACINIRQEVQIAYNNSIKLTEQLPILEKHKEASEQVAVAYKKQFDIGERTLLDALDIESELFQAERSYVNAHYDLENSKANTLMHMGYFTESIGLRKSQLPALEDLGAEPIQVDPATACPLYDIAEADEGLRDSDGDGVLDIYDLCPNTPAGDKVDEYGCSIREAKPAATSLIQFSKEPSTHRLDVLFPHDSSYISENYYQDIVALADFMNKNPEVQVVIEGHTSLVGPADYNKWLSQKRADSVKNVLVKELLVDESRVTAVGHGLNKPLSLEDNDKAHDLNRRVEAVISLNEDYLAN